VNGNNMSDTTRQDPASKSEPHPPLPPDALIILPVRQTVLFPGIMLPLTIGRPPSIAAAQEAVRSERMLGVILQTDPAVEDPKPEQLHKFGSVARVLRYVTAPDGTHHVICQGVRRFRVIEFLPGYPFLVARVEEIAPAEVLTPEIEARVNLLRERAREAVQLLRSTISIRRRRSPISSAASATFRRRRSRRCWRRSTSRSVSTRCWRC
jgi:ATP-dependent Lon protease